MGDDAAPDAMSMIRCPACHSQLELFRERLSCAGCDREFPLSDGRPVLRRGPISAEELEYSRGVRARIRGHPLLYRWLFRLFAPVLVTGPNPVRRLGALAESGGIVIDVGSGNDRRHPAFRTIDRLPYPQVDIIADGDRLPLADESVDGFLCLALLEHVADPAAVVAEAARVLRPGGRAFVVVPFLQPFHAAPNDFRRWTLRGLENELELHFELHESGVYCGPASAGTWIAAELLALSISLGVPSLHANMSLPAQAICSPLKCFDFLLAHLPGAHHAAAALYIDAVRR